MTIRMGRDDAGQLSTGGFPLDKVDSQASSLSPFRQARRVLVVENDFMLAEDLRLDLERQGIEVVGPAASVAEALDLLGAGPAPDAAILDIYLDDETVYPVVDALRSQDIPFVLATNRQAWVIPPAYSDVPRTEKPVDMRRLVRADAPPS